MEPIDAHLRAAISDLAAPVDAAPSVDNRWLSDLFEAQARSRHIDFAARALRASGRGFYTISSAGHEANAMVAMSTRPSDPALLHYRSGAFYAARACQVDGINPVRDILLGIVAAAADPASGGRHKVFGRAELAIIPQTSTIASHLPRAVGVADAVERSRRIGVASAWPDDAIVVSSFGDASINHSTAVGAFNAVANNAFRGDPLPLLLVCEDNGFGISVRTPDGWVETALSRLPSVRYEYVDGADVVAAMATMVEVADKVRADRAPAVVHLRTVRLMGHAGSDAEISYRSQREIEDDYRHDPLLATARALISQGVSSPAEVLVAYDRIADEVGRAVADIENEDGIASTAELVAPIYTHSPERVAATATSVADAQRRLAAFRSKLPEDQQPMTLAQAINAALTDLLAAHDDVLIFGEDVGVKGGVYGVTAGLQRKFGVDRVFDTILDEQTILGTALGAAISGLVPIPEIQYLAYLHNAEDQLRGEAASLSFFSAGAYRNAMVVRVAGLAYQQGFGGHFHNDNAIAVLRDIPGLIVAVPSCAEDAPGLLRACEALARVDGRVCVFLEPIALYHRRDLYDDGDGLMLHRYRGPTGWDGCTPVLGETRVARDGGDLTIVTFGNGVAKSLRVARRLAQRGHECRVVDLRWLVPLSGDEIHAHAVSTGRVLVVDETRRSAGVAEGVIAGLVDRGFGGPITRVASEDSFVPLGDATRFALLDEDAIEAAALTLLG